MAEEREITLRQFDLSDLDDYMVWASDDRVTAFFRWDSYTDKEDLRRYMRETVLPHPWFRAICLGGRPIGALSVELGVGCHRCKGELGYMLATAHWGRGYATARAKMAEERETEITLRRFDLSDLDDYMVWASDDRVTAFCRWDSYTDKEDLRRYMRETVLPHPWFRAICLGGRPIGALSVELGVGCHRCKGELGYMLATAHWGRGYATAAVKMAVRSVFQEVEGLERVEALVDVDNKGSQRVLEKAGFVREGVLRKSTVFKGRTRDSVMFSFISTDASVD